MRTDERYMYRCLQLAKLGAGDVAPNPMVGAVLVHKDRIIGEGYHKLYGQAHAEVNCLASVKKEDESLIPHSTMFVSLEPCAHHGKTPPCADLIIQKKIPRVVIGCRDPFYRVDGKGIEKLTTAGIVVELGMLEEECRELNKRFFTFHTKCRPYVILKWAQTLDGKIARQDYGRLLISNEYTNRIVHKWRSEEMSILVGTNTALHDDPELTTRHWPGRSPIRMLLDKELSLHSLKLLRTPPPTIVFNLKKHNLNQLNNGLRNGEVNYYQITNDVDAVPQILNAAYQMNILSILVEGGAFLLQSFIDSGEWDEARVITNEELSVGAGLPSPTLKNASIQKSEQIFSDRITIYKNQHASQR